MGRSERETAGTGRIGNRYLVLALLLLVYIFNFADRMLLGVMATPIKDELHLTDGQLGLLGGTAFALLYATLGVPIGWLADRYSRSWIITVSLCIWSGFTALCGFATGFVTLFLTRLGVGIGEAGGVAPSYSMIADYFGPGERARALGVFSFGIPIGGAIGLAFGGIIATAFDWRTAFITMGAAGLLIAPVFRWLVRDPVRGGAEHGPVEHGPADERPKLAAAIRIIARKPAFWLISFGSALGSTASYGISFWIPSFYVRSFDMPLSQVTLLYAAIILSGGITGIWLGAWLGDRIGPRRPGAYIAIPMCALLVSIPFFALAVLATSPMLSMGLLFIPTMLGSMGYGTVLAAVQNVVPATLRSTASALFLFINNLIGLGLGSAVLGFISDKLTQQYGAQSLRYALLSGALFYLAAAIFYLMAARRVAKDWEA
ncbi:spinster family MFS transporter [Sphingopyxis granuli]|uniref:Major facilitator family transporter n=1 Tax=Sphingopyxis granuli TaxID=267128 RepID=A0AA86GKY3_9SPHN|nr:MFS transporter [Sphingopyxis granuli]AMG74120.1 Major facilitator family transporter [Sphingopyxis granuli]QUM70758.1 MFS transporter [Sphingopyxis granuli]